LWKRDRLRTIACTRPEKAANKIGCLIDAWVAPPFGAPEASRYLSYHKLMTDQEKLTNFETLQHISHVRDFLGIGVCDIIIRAKEHDQTKLQEPELSIFIEYTPKLAQSTYGSEEYKQFLKEMKPALDHHYAENRHHPEYFPNGVNDMNLIDLLEMLCDWKAATLRHNNGDIKKSIEINKQRFGLSEQLVAILHNTIKMLER
jgi:hypothetical protein